MRLVVHNHFAGAVASMVARAAVREKTRRTQSRRSPTLTTDCGGNEDCGCGCDNHAHDAGPDEYFVRVDQHLTKLPTLEAKKAFLRKQFDEFDKRYMEFKKKAKGGPNETPENYIATLAGLKSRLDNL